MNNSISLAGKQRGVGESKIECCQSSYMPLGVKLRLEWLKKNEEKQQHSQCGSVIEYSADGLVHFTLAGSQFALANKPMATSNGESVGNKNSSSRAVGAARKGTKNTPVAVHKGLKPLNEKDLREIKPRISDILNIPKIKCQKTLTPIQSFKNNIRPTPTLNSPPSNVNEKPTSSVDGEKVCSASKDLNPDTCDRTPSTSLVQASQRNRKGIKIFRKIGGGQRRYKKKNTDKNNPVVCKDTIKPVQHIERTEKKSNHASREKAASSLTIEKGSSPTAKRTLVPQINVVEEVVKKKVAFSTTFYERKAIPHKTILKPECPKHKRVQADMESHCCPQFTRDDIYIPIDVTRVEETKKYCPSEKPKTESIPKRSPRTSPKRSPNVIPQDLTSPEICDKTRENILLEEIRAKLSEVKGKKDIRPFSIYVICHKTKSTESILHEQMLPKTSQQLGLTPAQDVVPNKKQDRRKPRGRHPKGTKRQGSKLGIPKRPGRHRQRDASSSSSKRNSRLLTSTPSPTKGNSSPSLSKTTARNCN